jgi:hypothetical protein
MTENLENVDVLVDGRALSSDRRARITNRVATAVVALYMLSLTACGTMFGGAVGAGSGAAIGAGTGYGAKKGALIGGGVGAAAGAVYDILN